MKLAPIHMNLLVKKRTADCEPYKETELNLKKQILKSYQIHKIQCIAVIQCCKL